MRHDIRWKLRFHDYLRALPILNQAVELSRERPLSELERQGLIQGFEFTHELAWNVLKDFLEEKGITGLIGSRDAIRSAFRNGLIDEGETWMDMIRERNMSSHTYNQDIAARIANNILTRFHPLLVKLAETMTAHLDEET
jgi:nucleotidyltransferase substrate binding protein (TIGR01987 family)